MDFFSKPVLPDLSDVMPCTTNGPVYHDNLINSNVVDDGISSLLKMAESMEALLPPDVSNDMFRTDNSSSGQTSPMCMIPSITQRPISNVSTQVNNRNSYTSEIPTNTEPVPASHFLSEHFPTNQCNDGLQILSFLSRETSCEEISNNISYATPDIPASPTDIHPFSTNGSSSSATNSSHSQIPIELTALVSQENIFYPACSNPNPAPALDETLQCLGTLPFANLSHLSQASLCDEMFTPMSGVSPVNTVQIPLDVPNGGDTSLQSCQEGIHLEGYHHENRFKLHKHKSNEDLSRISKSRKATRKPKTYSKPVASRFCHICSRMPRRGQGSAICKRISEGLCRKIVCEQCIREQGWDFDAIKKDHSGWLCPHCADICPSRSQCHIYNRINARRKRTSDSRNNTDGTGQTGKSGISDKSPMSSERELRFSIPSSSGLFVDNFQSQGVQQILQPPPNFRLNLPLPYKQL